MHNSSELTDMAAEERIFREHLNEEVARWHMDFLRSLFKQGFINLKIHGAGLVHDIDCAALTCRILLYPYSTTPFLATFTSAAIHSLLLD